MTDIKEYLKYYAGCKARIDKITYALVHYFGFNTGNVVDLNFRLLQIVSHPSFKGDVKPILSRLSDMTEQELNECGNIDYDFSDDPELSKFTWKNFDLLSANQFHYLINKQYWLFGDEAFEKGLIIDRKTIEK